MRHGSLFSGIGGFELAADWMGWRNLFHCEINPFGRKVLNYYWPESECYEDITKANFNKWRGTIDILSGGFPCQPYSTAGKRLGKEDERHLWPEMLRAIQEIKPKYIVGENVSGIVSWNGGLVFEQVQFDLENEGYEVQAVILPACAVNAPHRRDRVWFVANTIGDRRQREGADVEEKNREKRFYENRQLERRPKGLCRTGHVADSTKEYDRRSVGKQEEGQTQQPGICIKPDYDPNANSHRLQRRTQAGDSKNRKWKSNSKEQFKGCGQSDNWEQWPTQSPLCSRDDGLSSKLVGITFSKFRQESIKAFGNAVVPQVVYQIFKVINSIEYASIEKA